MSTTTIAALRAALDAGDDGVLPVLADALEDAGDPLAAGVRLIGDRRPRRVLTLYAAVWRWRTAPLKLPGPDYRPGPEVIGRELMLRMGLGGYTWSVDYSTRAAAFLALALALAPEAAEY